MEIALHTIALLTFAQKIPVPMIVIYLLKITQKESPSPSPTTDTDSENEEVPKTGDKSLSLVYYGLLLALSGLVLFYKRVRTLKAK